MSAAEGAATGAPMWPQLAAEWSPKVLPKIGEGVRDREASSSSNPRPELRLPILSSSASLLDTLDVLAFLRCLVRLAASCKTVARSVIAEEFDVEWIFVSSSVVREDETGGVIRWPSVCRGSGILFDLFEGEEGPA